MKFHIHMLVICRIYLNHDSDCGRFECLFLVRSFFGKCRFNLLHNIGGVLEKCYIMLHMVGGWSKNTIFALYNM